MKHRRRAIMPVSAPKKTLLHVAKARLGLPDEDYRDLLFRVAGVRSSNELDQPGFERVMREFERLGFQSEHGQAGLGLRVDKATGAQVASIRRLYRRYTGNRDDRRLGRWLEIHFHVSNPRFLDAAQAGKVVAILESMNAKKSGTVAPGSAEGGEKG